MKLTIPALFPWQRKLVRMAQGLDPDTGEPRDIRVGVCVMGRRAGKTMGCAQVLGKEALRQPRTDFFWGAHTVDGASIGRRTLMGPIITRASGEVEEYSMFGPVVDRHVIRPPEAEFRNGSRILWRALEKGHGAAIGRGNRLAVVDEAARVPAEVFWEDLFPTVADTGGRIILITTPRGEKNWVYTIYQRAREGNPQYAWVHGPSTENPSPDVQEFIKLARDAGMPEDLYRQEFLGEFIEGEGAVFRNIRECASLEGWRDTPAEGALYVVAADLAKKRDYTVIGVMDVLTGELHHAWRFRGQPWPVVSARIAEVAKGWGPGEPGKREVAPIWIDSTGVGDAPFDELVAGGMPVNGVIFSGKGKENLIVALRVALEKKELAYPPVEELMHELEIYEMEMSPTGRIRYNAPDGKHDDFVDMLALANWARKQAVGWNSGGGAWGWI